MNLIVNAFYGQNEPNGDSQRLVERYGAETRIVLGPVKLASFAKWDDWGPYDYHRDFNLTFPLQLGADLSWSLGMPDWLDMPGTRVGLPAHLLRNPGHPGGHHGHLQGAGRLLAPVLPPGGHGTRWDHGV